MAQIIDGKKISAAVKAEVAAGVAARKERGIETGRAGGLVGGDPPSRVYLNKKKKACALCGIRSFEYTLPAETSEEELLRLVGQLNADPAVNGILVQLPLPPQIDEQKVIAAIAPEKDVDAFTEGNVGRIMIGDYHFLPCTPAGCMTLIDSTGVSVDGKNCVVVGRSNIVGKPMAMLLLHRNGTVTICHSHTKNLAEICSQADILVSAVGKAGFITAPMVKEGAVVIDVGMNRNAEGKLCGDVDFEAVEKKAGFITPVPGGVGPMTIAMLMRNTLTAAKLQNSVE